MLALLFAATAKGQGSNSSISIPIAISLVALVVSIASFVQQHRSNRRGDPIPSVTQWKAAATGGGSTSRTFHIVVINNGAGETTISDVGLREYEGTRIISIQQLRDQGRGDIVDGPDLSERLEGYGTKKWALTLTSYRQFDEVAMVQAFAHINQPRRWYQRKIERLPYGLPPAIYSPVPEYHVGTH
jgi:hypothetical protein